jgi:hypothetical protein
MIVKTALTRLHFSSIGVIKMARVGDPIVLIGLIV